MIRRLRLPIARFSLLAGVVLTSGGCCRCWWPGPTPSSATATATSTGGDEGLDGGNVGAPAAGGAKRASLSPLAFAPDPSVPLHGSVMLAPRAIDDPLFFDSAQGKQRRFVPHSATSAAAMVNGDVVVEANTGISAHASASFARGARIVPPPIAAMAASPDGRTLAYVSGEGSSVATVHVLPIPTASGSRRSRASITRGGFASPLTASASSSPRAPRRRSR